VVGVVVIQEEVVMPVKIDRHMKVVIVVVVNNVHNVLINLKDNNHRLKQVDLNKVLILGEMKQGTRIKHLVVIVVAVVAEVEEIMKEAEEIMKEVEEIMKEAEEIMKGVEEVMKEVEAVVDPVVAVDAEILVTEILKKVHSNSNNNNRHKRAVDGNKVPSM
jgi:phage terminase small subunit